MTTQQAARPGLDRAAQPASSHAHRPQRIHRDRSGYLFMTPWFIGLAAVTIGPMVISLYLSFTNYDLLSDPQWVGFKNFQTMFTADPRYWNSVRVTLLYVLVSVPVRMLLALAIALLLNRRRRGVGLYRAFIYLPSLLGGSVAIAVVWKTIFDSNGAADVVLGFFGIHPGSLIFNPSTAIWTLIALAAWQFGAPMVIFLAGLKQVPAELYEAAELDGAGKVRQFFSVTIPMLSPVIFFNLVLEVIGAFQSFTPASIISNGTGGPADSTLVYTLYLYQRGFSGFDLGYASAMAWVLLIVVGVITAILFRTSRRWVFYSGDQG